MSRHRLDGRVARLERGVLWTADLWRTALRLMAEAGAAVELSAPAVQNLCTALQTALEALRQDTPACLTALPAVEALLSRLCEAVVRTIDTQVADPSTRQGLRGALSQAFAREAGAPRH